VTDDRTRGRFAQWLWRPPRAHGETIAGRTVSFLELFYDLVYVAVIGQASHHLAEHVTLRGTAEFGVVFALIWIAWVNGSLYLELHGREDGRTRLVVFAQMGVLVLLAVFTADAANGSGRPFALVYAAFLAVMTWLWYSVRRQDHWGHTEFLAAAGGYVTGMSVGVAAILVSAFLPADARLVVWACAALGWLVGMALAGRSEGRLYQAVPPSESLVERIGLFTIIVLGEVVFGVVDGLSAHDRDTKTITTGMIALVIGFGFWWIYFDLVGRRLPRRDNAALARWLLSHLPITLSITAAGAAMVSLIGHAHDASTPASTAWLLSGAVALGLIALIPTERASSMPAGWRSSTGRSARHWPAGPAPPSSSAGHARRRGSSPCSWWRCCRWSGSSPSPGSCAPMRGATRRPVPNGTSTPPLSPRRAERACDQARTNSANAAPSRDATTPPYTEPVHPTFKDDLRLRMVRLSPRCCGGAAGKPAAHGTTCAAWMRKRSRRCCCGTSGVLRMIPLARTTCTTRTRCSNSRSRGSDSRAW
jgi:low temperature requirement protein LtrA